MISPGSRPGRAQALSAAVLAALCLGLLIGPVAALGQPVQNGGIRGRVTDRRTGKPLAGAPVVFQSGSILQNALTNTNGQYQMVLPPATYVVRSYFDLYHGVRVSKVELHPGEMLEVNIALPRIDEDRDVSVQELEIPYRADTTTAAAQDQLRLASGGIGEGMGSKQMSQVGASDAGAAAARVVGVTLEQSQLVVRGLGGRYNRVLLNGIPVPASDPDSPGVDLDMFPAGVIDSLNLSKTFSPDTPADFAGGVLEIKSVTFPRKLTFELEASFAVNTEAAFRERVDYDGGKRDWLGFDDGGRALPGAIPGNERLIRNEAGRYKTQADVEAAAETFRNRWQYGRNTALPSMGLEANLGDSRKFGRGKRWGYFATASYDHADLRRTGISRPNPTLDEKTGDLIKRNDYRVETGSEEVQLTALGTASLDLGLDHSLTVLTLYNRLVSDETTYVSGRNENLDDNAYQKWQLDFLSRQLWFNQLLGEHRNLLGTRLRFRWAGYHAQGNRDEPDRRTVGMRSRDGVPTWNESSGSGERFFSELGQTDVGATASMRFPLWAQAWGNLGGWASLSQRSFDNRRFRMFYAGGGAAGTMDGIDRSSVESIFSPAGIGPVTRMEEETKDTDSYESSQKLYAGYLLLETPLVGRLSFSGGVRTEIVTQEVTSHSPFTAPGSSMSMVVRTDRTDVDHLPGGALKYQLTDRQVLRAAYGMTVSRPQIRELAPFQFYDFVRERSIEGNPKLERTLIHNGDLRWEWFFGDGEVASVSAFYKRFHKPIELQIGDPDSGASLFINADSAWSMGGEAELRLSLGRLTSALRWFSVDTNLSLIQSKIEIPKEKSSAVRPNRRLFGQAPYVANVSFRFRQENDAHRDVTAALVYNVVGPRITDVGVTVNTVAGNQYFPDIEETPFHSLDLVASVRVLENVKLKLKVRNLLLQEQELRQGDYLVRRRAPGLSASLGLGFSY